MALAAVLPARSSHHPTRDARRLWARVRLALGGLALAVALVGDALPEAIPPDLSPDGRDARVVGNPTVLGAHLAVMVLFGVAAAGFARLRRAHGRRAVALARDRVGAGRVCLAELLPVPVAVLAVLLRRRRAAARVLPRPLRRRCAGAAPDAAPVVDRRGARRASTHRPRHPRRHRSGPRVHPSTGAAARRTAGVATGDAAHRGRRLPRDRRVPPRDGCARTRRRRAVGRAP